MKLTPKQQEVKKFLEKIQTYIEKIEKCKTGDNNRTKNRKNTNWMTIRTQVKYYDDYFYENECTSLIEETERKNFLTKYGIYYNDNNKKLIEELLKMSRGEEFNLPDIIRSYQTSRYYPTNLRQGGFNVNLNDTIPEEEITEKSTHSLVELFDLFGKKEDLKTHLANLPETAKKKLPELFTPKNLPELNTQEELSLTGGKYSKKKRNRNRSNKKKKGKKKRSKRKTTMNN